jgi:hypothetical protein
VENNLNDSREESRSVNLNSIGSRRAHMNEEPEKSRSIMDEEEEQNEAFIKMGDEVDELNVKQENENMAARPKISLNNEKRAQEEPIETCEVE